MDILSFRPGVAKSGTAFEAMAKIYEQLVKKYGHSFTLVTYPEDDFESNVLNSVTVDKKEIKSKLSIIPGAISNIPPKYLIPRKIIQEFRSADAVLTLDPTTFAIGKIGLRCADKFDTSIWFDSGRTTKRPWLGTKWKIERRMLRSDIEQVSGIIATSPKVLERFREMRLFSETIASKFNIMGHPVDTNKFRSRESAEDDSVITSVGRLVPEKGFYYILEALTPLLQDRDNIRWVIIGDGPLEGLIKNEIRERQLEDCIELVGTVSHGHIPEYLNRSDIYVSHSVDVSYWEEFFGVANLEAMACEIPCILTDSGSIPYVVRQAGSCEIIPQRSITEIRNSVRHMLDNDSYRDEMGRIGREFIEDTYSVESIAMKYNRMLVSQSG